MAHEILSGDLVISPNMPDIDWPGRSPHCIGVAALQRTSPDKKNRLRVEQVGLVEVSPADTIKTLSEGANP